MSSSFHYENGLSLTLLDWIFSRRLSIQQRRIARRQNLKVFRLPQVRKRDVFTTGVIQSCQNPVFMHLCTDVFTKLLVGCQNSCSILSKFGLYAYVHGCFSPRCWVGLSILSVYAQMRSQRCSYISSKLSVYAEMCSQIGS